MENEGEAILPIGVGEMKIGYGILAGFVATVVLSAIMLMKSAMGMMPQVNAIQMLTKMGASYAGLPLSPALGWAMHFFIGTIMWGVAFAVLAPLLPGAYWLRGVFFSIGAWLLMMVIPMPLAGAGFFGTYLGIAAPVATLVLHLIFGIVLGAVYGALIARAGEPEEQRREHRHEPATQHR